MVAAPTNPSLVKDYEHVDRYEMLQALDFETTEENDEGHNDQNSLSQIVESPALFPDENCISAIENGLSREERQR